MRKNNGQVLVAFVMLLPIFFMLMALVVDIGLLYVSKRQIDNTLKYAIKDSIESKRTKEELENIIILNCEDIKNLDVEISEFGASAKYKGFKKSIFSIVLGKFEYDIESNYVGSIKGDKVTVERVK